MTPATKALPTKVKCEFESALNLLSFYTYQQEHLPLFLVPCLWLIFVLPELGLCPQVFVPCMQVFWLEIRMRAGSHLDSTA